MDVTDPGLLFGCKQRRRTRSVGVILSLGLCVGFLPVTAAVDLFELVLEPLAKLLLVMSSYAAHDLEFYTLYRLRQLPSMC